MAMTKEDIIDWLNTFVQETVFGIDEGGLTLRAVYFPECYLEIGGIPEEIEDAEYEEIP